MTIQIDGTSGISGVNGSATTPALQGTDTNTGLTFGTDTVGVVTDGATRTTVDSSGRLLVGETSSTQAGSIDAKAQVVSNDFNAALTIRRNQTGDGAPGVLFCKSRGTSNSANVAVSDDDGLGNIRFFGADATGGNDFAEGGAISCVVDGTPGSDDMPARLEFKTTGDGASSPTARAVIDSTGRLNLSTASQAANFTRSASLRVLSGTIPQNATFEMGNTGFTSTMINVACERGGTSAYNFIELYSGRRYDNSSGDRETSLEGDGNNYCDGSWSGGGADYAEMFEWLDANTDAEDRRGLSVVLDGDKIREAVAGEDPIGVISGNPSVVGDAAWNKWNEKYLTDDFGTYQKETYSLTEWEDENGKTQSYESDRIPADVTVPDDAVIKTVDDAGVTLTRRILNPNYDPDVAYVPRKERAEWDPVGLMGKLRIRKGQVTGARWIKMRDVSDTVEEWLVR